MSDNKNTGYLCLIILLKFFGKAVEEEHIKSLSLHNNNEFNEIDMINISKKFKLKAKITKVNVDKLSNLYSPIIAKDKNDNFFLVVKNKEDSFMIMNPQETQPQVVSREQLKQIWSGMAVVVTQKGGIDKEAIFSFKWFIPTILKFKKEFIQVLIAVFTIQILGILTPVMTQVVVDKVLIHNSMTTLKVLAIGIGIVYIYELILGLAKNYVFTHTTNRIDVMLSSKLFNHLFALPLKYFESRKVGETVARVRELDSIRSFLTGTPLSSIIDLIFIVVYIIVLFFYNTKLTIIVLCSIPIYAILSAIVTPLFKKRLDEKFNTGAETQSFLVEAITGVQTVKSFSLKQKFENKWGDLQSDYVKASYKTSMVSATAGTIGQFIQKMFDLLILFFGAMLVMQGNLTVGQLVAFRMLSGRVSGPVLRLVQLWQEYQQASLSVKRIGDIFNNAPEQNSNINGIIPKLSGKIVFDKVHFKYNIEASDVIKDMSFCIEPNTIIGVVGRSGSGKSTISKLIQRLYIPHSGKISIDGMDLSTINPSALRKQIGVVLQENFMFNGTVKDNISIHMPSATLEMVIQAAKTAGAHDFILELPNGYDTIIGEKGIGLSGGQKQRIAIARAIINDPRILIFDEATSALDYESESIIQNNLKDICKNRTVIIIAHRLSTLKDAQKIIVIDKGNLIEYDTHENLMKNKGLYYYLYSKQHRGEIDE